MHIRHNTSNPLPTAYQIMAEFPSVFDGQVRMMPGEHFHISLTEDARPFCVTTPRSIPFAYREKLNQEIDLVDQEIITPVTEPTDWCAAIVVAPKKGTDRICMCVDLSKLNKFVRQERHPSVTPATGQVLHCVQCLKGLPSMPLGRRKPKVLTPPLADSNI